MDLPTKEQIDAMVSAASTALSGDGTTVLGMQHVRHTKIERWTVCRAPQQPSCARLLDVAVKVRQNEDEPVLAILDPPLDKASKPSHYDEKYLRSYQSRAWRGCHVAFVLGTDTLWNPDPAPLDRGDFDQLVDEIAQQLQTDRSDANGFWMKHEDSRELEGLVRISMNRALARHEFKRHVDDDTALGKTYRGFWRRAEADGVWTRSKGAPRSVALEVKMDEDVEAPLCQVIDHLAHASAVVLVRDTRRDKEPEEQKKRAMESLVSRELVR